MDKVYGEVVFEDYPDGKFAKKVDWWHTEQGLEIIRRWRTQGYSIKEVAKKMGIDLRTLNAWRKKYPEFDEKLAEGKESTIAKVEHSLFERATGYDYQEEVWELIEGEMRLVRIFKKHAPPDIKAILNFLYNRDPQHWRAIQEPLEKTQYTETIKNVLIAMKEVAETGQDTTVDVTEVDITD